MSGHLLRPCTQADLHAVRMLHALAFEQLAAGHHSPEQLAAHRALTLTNDYAADLRASHLAVAEDREHGIVATAGWIGVPGEAGTARIRKVFVHPGMARHGVATRLVLDAERRATAAGHVRFVVRANVNAVPLYRKLGYAPVREARMDAAGVQLPVVFMNKGG